MSALTDKEIRFSNLGTGQPTAFDLRAPAADCAAIAADLGILAIRKLRLTGTLAPQGAQDWVLNADLGATVVQSCGVTLDPVTTRIEETLQRQYVADLPETTGDDIEMPLDDTVEALPQILNLQKVMIEALALTLPAYPRRDDADPGDTVYTAPGITPMTDADVKPFAGLGALRDSLTKKSE